MLEWFAASAVVALAWMIHLIGRDIGKMRSEISEAHRKATVASEELQILRSELETKVDSVDFKLAGHMGYHRSAAFEVRLAALEGEKARANS